MNSFGARGSNPVDESTVEKIDVGIENPRFPSITGLGEYLLPSNRLRMALQWQSQSSSGSSYTTGSNSVNKWTTRPAGSSTSPLEWRSSSLFSSTAKGHIDRGVAFLKIKETRDLSLCVSTRIPTSHAHHLL